MGAPRRTTEDRERLLAVLRAGASRAAACAAARFPRRSFYEAMERDPAFAEDVAAAEAEAEAAAALLVRRASAEDWRAAAWWLEHSPSTKSAWRTIYRQEITGADGGPIRQQAIVFAPDAEWLRAYAKGLAELPAEIRDPMLTAPPALPMEVVDGSDL